MLWCWFGGGSYSLMASRITAKCEKRQLWFWQIRVETALGGTPRKQCRDDAPNRQKEESHLPVCSRFCSQHWGDENGNRNESHAVGWIALCLCLCVFVCLCLPVGDWGIEVRHLGLCRPFLRQDYVDTLHGYEWRSRRHATLVRCLSWHPRFCCPGLRILDMLPCARSHPNVC